MGKGKGPSLPSRLRTCHTPPITNSLERDDDPEALLDTA